MSSPKSSVVTIWCAKNFRKHLRSTRRQPPAPPAGGVAGEGRCWPAAHLHSSARCPPLLGNQSIKRERYIRQHIVRSITMSNLYKAILSHSSPFK